MARDALTRVSFVDFCSRTLRLKLTLGQRVVARVCFDGVEPNQLDPAERALARVIFGDVDVIPLLARKILVLILGRGSGKTMLAAAFAIYTLVTLEITGHSIDLPTFVVIAPGKKTAIDAVVHMARELVRGAPGRELEDLVVSESADGFILQRHDGRKVRLSVFAASRGGASARGIPILGWVIDESWFFYSEDGGFVVNDRDIVNALLPRMMKGARGILISTPWPVETLTGTLLDANFANPTTALACIAPTLTMRDDDPELPGQIALERANDPENTARERDCNVRAMTGSSKFFDPTAIDHAIDPEIILPAPAPPGSTVGAGMDLGLKRDSAALVIAANASDVVRLIAVKELTPKKGAPLKLSETIATFAKDLASYNLRSVTADGWCREPAREYTEPAHIGIDDAPEGQRAKQESYILVRKLFTEGRLLIPNVPRLVAQLKSVISKEQPGGGLKIETPRRAGQGHGDLMSAAVLAIFATNSAPCRIPAADDDDDDASPRASAASFWGVAGRGF